MTVRFEDDFLAKLEPLRLAVRRRIRGLREGERTTPRRGAAMEFHSHRPYVPGDDPRRIDWNLYARLGNLFIQERVRDESPVIHLFIDTSESMGFGKIGFAARMAAALGVVALGEGATVLLQGTEPCGRVPALLSALEKLRPEGGTPWSRFSGPARRDGRLSFFISDFWEEEWKGVLRDAGTAGEAGMIHLLAREEAAPEMDGRIRFIESETGRTCIRFVGAEEREGYRNMLEDHCLAWKRWAEEREIAYLRCTTATSWEEAVFVLLRESGMIA